jgi:threonylcarbamoyladenosine tRNA methylthiotransferase MtaB
MKIVKFYTLGCKVNQYETQALREQLLDAGFEENIHKIADICIINTCTVTSQADAESRRIVRKALRHNPNSKIIVTGCWVERDAQEIQRICDRIQIVPNYQKHRIIDVINSAIPDSQFLNDKSFIPLNISEFKGHQRAFVKIQDGCNNFCSYCKVPLVRGKSRSRNLNEIATEIKCLVAGGFKEIVLSGICLGDYRHRDIGLVNLLIALEKIKGRFRIRLSSIEPHLLSAELIERIADSKKICPHLHIPLQSGDNKILKKMNRNYTVEGYLSLIERIKKKIKDVAITTDILVGFPGETEVNFRNTIICLQKILPLRTHIFSFSPRQGTAAFSFKPRIDSSLIKERFNQLKELAIECSYKFRKHFLGKSLTILIESQVDKNRGFFCGYSENYIRVSVENACKKDINNLVQAKVKAVDMYSTQGIIS